MEDKLQTPRVYRQSLIKEYQIKNANTDRSPRKDIHKMRPGKKYRGIDESRALIAKEATSESHYFKSYDENQLPKNSNAQRISTINKSFTKNFKKKKRKNSRNHKMTTRLTESILRNHTRTCISDVNILNSKDNLIEKIRYEYHQNYHHKISLTGSIENFSTMYKSEKRALVNKNISMKKTYAENIAKIFKDSSITKYTPYISSFCQFCKVENFSLSYAQLHALTTFLKQNKVIFGHDIFFGKATTCMAAAYCIKHCDSFDIFMVANEERHSDLKKQRSLFCGSIIKLLRPGELVLFNQKVQVNKKPYMLIAIDFMAIIDDPQFQSEFFVSATSEFCKKLICTSNALFGMKDGSTVPGNAYGPLSDFVEFIETIMPCIKLTSSEPNAYQYDIDVATGDMKPSMQSISKVKHQVEKFYSENYIPDAKSDGISISVKLIATLLKFYSDRIIIKSRKDKMIIQNNPYILSRTRIKRILNLPEQYINRYDFEILKLSLLSWSKKSVEDKREYIKSLDKLSAFGKVNSLKTMLIYASMRGHCLLVVSKYQGLLQELYRDCKKKERLCSLLLTLEKGIEDRIKELESELERANVSQQTAVSMKKKNEEIAAEKKAISIMKILGKLKEKGDTIKYKNAKAVHSLCLNQRIVFSTYDNLKLYSYNLKATGTPFVILIDRPYNVEDVKMCENCAPNETNKFQSTSVWIQSYNSIDTYIDDFLISMEKNDHIHKSWIDNPDDYMLPILQLNEFVYGEDDLF